MPGCTTQERLHDQPSTFVILNVGTNFSNGVWIAKAIQIIILNLKVFAHGATNALGEGIGVGIAGSGQDQAHGDGQIETIKGGFVFDDALITIEGKAIQIDDRSVVVVVIIRLGLTGEIEQLSQFGFLNNIQQQFDQIKIKGFVSKVTTQQAKDETFQQEGIINGNQLDVGQLVPAGLSATRLTVIHDIVRHQKEGL